MQLLFYSFILFLGIIIGFVLKTVTSRLGSYYGTIFVSRVDDKISYSLQVEDPYELAFKKQVVFKVETHSQ